MSSILVTVDDTPSAIAARGLAAALARQCGAQVRGVTALDVSDLDRVEPVPWQTRDWTPSAPLSKRTCATDCFG
jgi:nucleotide-binding universal stress UspA family protein